MILNVLIVLAWVVVAVVVWGVRLFETRQDITRHDTGELYLRRFFLWRGKSGRLLLHKFYRGDEDPHLHDHPWSFNSLILTRGYWEETPSHYYPADCGTFDPELQVIEGEVRKRIFYPRFSYLRRPAEWQHRVILKDKKPVWTLVYTRTKSRDWGFWIKDKLCPWRNYSQGVCWCGPEQEQQKTEG